MIFYHDYPEATAYLRKIKYFHFFLHNVRYPISWKSLIVQNSVENWIHCGGKSRKNNRNLSNWLHRRTDKNWEQSSEDKNDNKQNPEREQWCWYLSWEHLLIPRDLQLHANQARWLKNRDRPMDYTKWKDGSETLTKKWNNKIPKSWYLSWKNEQNFFKDSIVQGEKWVFAYFISISSGLRKNDHLFWKFLTRRLITIGLELKLYYLLL